MFLEFILVVYTIKLLLFFLQVAPLICILVIVYTSSIDYSVWRVLQALKGTISEEKSINQFEKKSS